MIQNNKFEGAAEEVMQSQTRKKHETASVPQREPSQRPQGTLEILINHQKQTKQELSEQVSNVENGLKDKLNIIIDMLSDSNVETSLDKSYMNILLFFQKLDYYLFDSSINLEFAAKVRHDINRVLALYGYKIVDFNENSDEVSNRHYDIEIIDSELVQDIEIESRAIVDKNENTIVKGKVYKKLYKH